MPAPAPDLDCWVHGDLEVRRSVVAQFGLFARAPISRGTVVCRVGGRLASTRELHAILAAAAEQPGHPYVDTIVVDEDLHLVLPSGQIIHYGNHSCDPNLWWDDVCTLSARRPIAAGEEVTNDYATSTGEPEFSMNCGCRSPLCRGTITGRDWQSWELQERYGDHWVPALLRRIRSAGNQAVSTI